eukprot:3288565-Amphidinium_carterae.1
MRILKSAYGLTEAPRLWYLRARELLVGLGWRELAEVKATFTYVFDNEEKTAAILTLHVDDGLVVGDFSDKRVRKLKDQIDQNFTIKEWLQVAVGTPRAYLGAQLSCEEVEGERCFIMDMNDYIVRKVIPIEVKEPVDSHAFRSLLQIMAWPARHVAFDVLYQVSALSA